MLLSKGRLLIVILFTYGLTGCFKKEEIKKLDIPTFEQGWGLPLVDTKLTLKDLVSVIDTGIGIKEERDKSYTFYYYDTVVSPKAEELLKLDDQPFNGEINFPISLTNFSFPLGAPPVSGKISETEIFDPGNGGRFKLVTLKSGILALNITNTFSHTVALAISFISLIDKNAIPLIKNITVPPLSSTNFTNLLDGYTLNLSENESEFNKLKYTIDYSIISTGAPVNSNDKISLEMDIKNLKYTSIIGDIGKINFPDYKGNFDLKVFEQASLGNVHFAHAKFKLTYNNSFGLPLNFTINKLHSSTFYGKEVDITDPNFQINLAYPLSNEIGASKKTVVILDSSNSRITDAINPAPNNLDFDFSTNVPTGLDYFIFNNSQVKVYAEIQIPVKGYVTNYEVQDTVEILKLPERNFDEDNIEGSIDSALFKIKFENQMPLVGSGQLYFLNRDYKIVDSLLLNPKDIIGSDNIFIADGTVGVPTIRESIVSMKGDRYDLIFDKAAYFYFILRFKTPINKALGKPYNISLQSSNSFRIVISVFTKGKIKVK